MSRNRSAYSSGSTPDPAAIDSLHSLYSQHNNWLTGWLARTLGHPQNAADLAQDTFIRVMTQANPSTVSDHRPWLLTIAKRILIDKSRRHKLEQAYLAELKLSSEDAYIEPSTEQLLVAVQTLELINHVLDKLAVKPRKAFLLRHINGLTLAEIADQLDVSITMVRKYLVQSLVACNSVIEDISA